MTDPKPSFTRGRVAGTTPRRRSPRRSFARSRRWGCSGGAKEVLGVSDNVDTLLDPRLAGHRNYLEKHTRELKRATEDASVTVCPPSKSV